MQELKISSLQNPRVKQIVKLRDRREREERGVFLIEGYRELLRAVEAGRSIDELYFCPELFLGENETNLMHQIQKQGGAIFECTRAVFEKLSYRDRPDGLLGVSEQIKLGLKDLEILLKGKPYPFLVIAEAIEKPGNLGTILRTCDAVGADALIVCNACTDIHNPNVVRASVGTLFSIPVIEAEGEPLLQFLKNHAVHILAATPSATCSYTDVDLKQPLAVAFGTEQYGLSSLWMEASDLKVRIPMKGKADSLNVAMATGVLLYEVLRQREHHL